MTRGGAILARGALVDLPRSLALRPAYPTLAKIEQRFLASIAFQSPRTGATYRDGMLRSCQLMPRTAPGFVAAPSTSRCPLDWLNPSVARARRGLQRNRRS